MELEPNEHLAADKVFDARQRLEDREADALPQPAIEHAVEEGAREKGVRK